MPPPPVVIPRLLAIRTLAALCCGLGLLSASGAERAGINRFDRHVQPLPALPGLSAGVSVGLAGKSVVAIGPDGAVWTLPLDAAAAWKKTGSRMPTAAAPPSQEGHSEPSVLALHLPGSAIFLGAINAQVRDTPLAVEALPALPAGHRPISGAASKNSVFAADQGHELFQLNLAPASGGRIWKDLGRIPGPADSPVVLAFQAMGGETALFAFGSAAPQFYRSAVGPVGPVGPLDPIRPVGDAGVGGARPPGALGRWKSLSRAGIVANPAAAVAVGLSHIVIFGADAHTASFDTVTQSWAEVPDLTVRSARAISAAGQKILILSSSPVLELTTFTSRVELKKLNHWDTAVLIASFGLLLGVSAGWSRRNRSTDDYFRGGRQVPWLAAGLSVVATRLSSTTFVSLPSKAFAGNWQYALIPLTNVVGAFIVARYFVKFFVRLNVTSGYEYLEQRFNSLIRTLGSLNYLSYEFARAGLLILVPAVALSAVAKIDLQTTIAAMGLVATVYTVLGGIEGVIWTDVIQICIKIGGGIVALVFILIRLDGGPANLASTAFDQGKLKLINWNWDLTTDSIWVLVLFWLSDGLKSYVANQTVIQRFISTRDENSAKRTVWTSAIAGVLISWLFLLIGTALYLFYQQHPGQIDLTMDKPDGVFPWYIAFELPAGVAGLLITPLLASALSCLDGSLNSTSTVIVVDFYRRFSARPTDRKALLLGRLLTASIGLGVTGLSCAMASMASKSLFDQSLSIIGLLGGGLGGLFLLGMLTTRSSSGSALAGFLCSAAVQYYVSQYTSLNLLTYMFTGMVSCLVAGYLASFIWPEKRDLDGLTVHTS